ncbi:hypothetical protein J4467_01010 [Candidatus Woesearchaeota archaeon]|nr:hypothetical protein [Candidatus Woesearchaeota archaeon]
MDTIKVNGNEIRTTYSLGLRVLNRYLSGDPVLHTRGLSVDSIAHNNNLKIEYTAALPRPTAYSEPNKETIKLTPNNGNYTLTLTIIREKCTIRKDVKGGERNTQRVETELDHIIRTLESLIEEPLYEDD